MKVKQISCQILAIVGLLSSVGTATAQDFKILEQGGEELDPDGVTVLRFEADEPALIGQMIEEGKLEGSATGVWSSLVIHGRTWRHRPICQAPCTVEVPNGVYRLRVGDPPGAYSDLGEVFTTTAAGGEQTWRVEEANVGLLVLGTIGTSLGAAGTLVGPGMMALAGPADDELLYDVGLTMLVVGLPSLVLGLWALIEGDADADRLR